MHIANQPSGTSVLFQRRQGAQTPWLQVEFPVGRAPAQLLADLAADQWVEEESGRRMPPFLGRQTILVSRPGSARFGEWTPADKTAFLPSCRKVLRRHGFSRVPMQTLTLADML